jgi:hypothetical protein
MQCMSLLLGVDRLRFALPSTAAVTQPGPRELTQIDCRARDTAKCHLRQFGLQLPLTEFFDDIDEELPS